MTKEETALRLVHKVEFQRLTYEQALEEARQWLCEKEFLQEWEKAQTYWGD